MTKHVANLKMAILIVHVPMNSMVIFHSYVAVYQRVHVVVSHSYHIQIPLYIYILGAAPACLFRVSVRFSEPFPKLSELFLNL